ncbi:MAG: APC family permease [Solirubrobacteraceae bacterium]
MSQVAQSHQGSYKAGSVSGVEVLAQSVSNIAPSAVVGAVIALVVATSGSASWVTWCVGGAVLLLIGLALTNITGRFGSAGGLYALATRVGGHTFGYFAAWMAAIAYLGGVVAVTFQISEFATGFFNLPAIGFPYTPATTFLIAFVGLALAAGCSYTNARVSTRTMLITESLSMLAITVLMIMVLATHHGSIVPSAEFNGVSISGITAAIPLVMFSFAGFETCTAFAREAKNPKRMITASLLGSVVVVSVFFIICSYIIVLAFHGTHYDMAKSTNVLATVSDIVGASGYGYAVDVGVILSMFAVIVALMNTSSRFLRTLAAEGALPRQLAHMHPTRGTPDAAIGFVWVGTVIGIAIVAATQSNVVDAFGNMGTLTGDGQGLLYILTGVAIIFMFARGRTAVSRRWLGGLAIATLASAALGYLLYKSFVPLPPNPTRVYVYVLFGIIAFAIILYAALLARRRGPLHVLGSSTLEYAAVTPQSTDAQPTSIGDPANGGAATSDSDQHAQKPAAAP